MDILMKELLTTDIGLMSLFSICAICGIGLFLWWRINKNIQEEGRI